MARNVSLLIISLLAILSNSIGFDIYSHINLSQSLQGIHHGSSGYVIFGETIPRYVGFQYLLYAINGIGFPLALFFVLVNFALLNYGRSCVARVTTNGAMALYAFLFAIVTVYAAPASMVVALIVGHLLNPRSRRLVGLAGLIHPIGLVYAVIVFVIQRRWGLLAFLATSVVALSSATSALVQDLEPVNACYNRETTEIVTAFQQKYSTKIKELVFGLFIFTAIFYAKLGMFRILPKIGPATAQRRYLWLVGGAVTVAFIVSLNSPHALMNTEKIDHPLVQRAWLGGVVDYPYDYCHWVKVRRNLD